MKRLIAIIVILFLSKGSVGQTTDQLVGRWSFQYSLQSNKDSCHLPKETSTLDLFSSGTYSWDVNGDIIKGEWKIVVNKIRLYNNKAINFEGTVADLLYPIELKKGFLIIHQPEDGDISCPHLYYKKR